MADIKDQLIKDSYNYVLQSDLSTGVVYRIGGSIPVNPIFSSGLTINDSLVYSGAGEQNGYALLTDGTGYAYWGPVSAATPSSGISGNGTVNYIPKWTGVTSIGNSIIYDNGTNIGIGTSSPTQKLTVSGNLLSTGIVFCTNTIASDSLQSNNIFPSDDLDLNISTRSDSGTKGINLMTGPKPGGLGYVRMKITSGGTIGINNETPKALLDILTPTGYTIGFIVSGNSDTDMVRITQTGGGNAIVVEDSSNPDSTPFVVAADGKVGIGTTSPENLFHVFAGSAGTVTSVAGTVATIENSTTNYLSMISPDNQYSGIVFGSPSDSFGAYMRWRQSDTFLDISTADFGDYIRLGAGNSDFKAYVTSTGFGVNTLPSQALNISGNTLIQGSLTATTKTTIGSESNISSALLQMASTTQGVLFPRMTNTQRESIVSPVSGLFVYCTDSPEGLFMYKSNGWVQIM